MQGRLRLLIIFAFVIVVVAVGAVILLGNQPYQPRTSNTPAPGTGGQATREPSETATPIATPIPMANIVVAVQELGRGGRIPPNGVAPVSSS